VSALSAQIAMELRRLYRNPRYLLFTILLPATFYIFFRALFGDTEVAGIGRSGVFLLVSSTAYGVMAATLISFAGRIAIERQRGWFSLLLTTPVTMRVVLGAKVVAALVASTGVVLAMFALGIALNGPGALPMTTWLALAAVLVLGALPFVALAFCVGYFFDADTAWSASLWLYFALAMIGGVFTPVEMMPSALQQIAVLTPAYRYAKLGWTLASGQPVSVAHVVSLGAYLVVFGLLAVVAYRRNFVARYT
jgi:ABC-2 type transport system permease protein